MIEQEPFGCWNKIRVGVCRRCWHKTPSVERRGKECARDVERRPEDDERATVCNRCWNKTLRVGDRGEKLLKEMLGQHFHKEEGRQREAGGKPLTGKVMVEVKLFGDNWEPLAMQRDASGRKADHIQ